MKYDVIRKSYIITKGSVFYSNLTSNNRKKCRRFCGAWCIGTRTYLFQLFQRGMLSVRAPWRTKMRDPSGRPSYSLPFENESELLPNVALLSGHRSFCVTCVWILKKSKEENFASSEDVESGFICSHNIFFCK